MFETSGHAPEEPSRKPPAVEPQPQAVATQGRALRLLQQTRAVQKRSLWLQGALFGFAASSVLLLGGALAGKAALLALALVVGVAVTLFFGLVLVRRRVGDDDRTARRIAQLAPELQLDLLAAVELSKALGSPNDFSPELARAFLRDIDAKAARHDAGKLINPLPVRRAALVALAAVLAVSALTFFQINRVRLGLSAAFEKHAVTANLRREPITGDFELSYRYPAYTGLEPRVVSGTSGELAGPAGTEVEIKTHADREVEAASLFLGDTAVPLTVSGRDLSGSLVLEKSGSYHVAFLDGERIVAEGPQLPVQVLVDEAPKVRLTAPVDEVELAPDQQSVTLKFEATDDYGLTAFDLVFKPSGGDEQRLSLKPDDGRATRGQYQWAIGALGLKAGSSVTYFLEATDNDTVTGPKKGVSKTQTITRYSQAEHRREALRKTQLLWEQLVTHLADRLESKERTAITVENSGRRAVTVDERAAALAGEFRNLSSQLSKEREPFDDLINALLNVGGELQRDQNAVAVHRRMYLRLLGRDATDPDSEAVRSSLPKDQQVYVRSVTQRLSENLQHDRDHSEKNVLYLEALLDRIKIDALKELAKDLKDDRKELSKLLEEFGRTKDEAVKQRIVQQIDALKKHMLELQQRMAELAKGIRDEFMNQEALDEMMQSENLDSALDEIEKLVREGKADEALKKMQELSMQMDEQLEQLEHAADQADERSDPELTKKFQAFSSDLDQATKQQEALAEKTKNLRDRYREQTKEKIAKQGAALKREVLQKLAQLEQSYEKLDGERAGMRVEDQRQQALRSIGNVKQSLEANDFDLAAEAAEKLEESAQRMADGAGEQRRLDEMFQNAPEVRRDSKQLNERLRSDAKTAQEIGEALRDLFPQGASQLTEGDRQQLGEFAKQQRQLEQKAEQLGQQMQELGERAPIFDEDAKQQMKQVGQRMGQAGQKLQARDASHGYGEQQGALQALKGLQQQLQQQQQRSSGKGKGMPMPLRSQGSGRGRDASQEKVEIPDEDPNRAPREFRKDVMDAMKQGAPERYQDQNKRYYEELVK